MIIDIHTHIFEAGSGGPFNAPASADDLIRNMDTEGVDVAVVLPVPEVACNEFVWQECARSGGRLIAFYNPDFTAPGQTIKKLNAFFSDFGIRGLKIHPRIQGVTVNDSIMLDVLEWAQLHAIPVLFDVFSWGKTLDNSALHPLAYHRVAQRFDKLPIILAHSGGYRLMEAFMVAKSNPNVYLDLSFTPVYFKGSSIAGDCSFLCHRLPPGRVLYGSDFPYVHYGDSTAAAKKILIDCDDHLSRSVMGEGAAELLGMAVRN